MKVLTGDKRYETIIFSMEEKKEGIDVCRVLDYREVRGEARGMARLNQLMSVLLVENRLDEMKKVQESDKIREEYLLRYGL